MAKKIVLAVVLLALIAIVFIQNTEEVSYKIYFWKITISQMILLPLTLLAAVLELLAFVIARKMLRPDLTAMDIILSVIAFVTLLAGRRYLMSRTCYEPGELPDEP